MRSYFAYTRVSTVKQGEFGSSLVEQRAAIEAYAGQQNLSIVGWFEELVSAAKQGRNAFNGMLSRLERGQAQGVIIHKIDRSARNLKDWARLGELMDRGIEVRFVHDNLDLATRGGRLSADIQAVVAADYVRNLREEVRKGIRGRYRQGLFPLPAPYGYLNSGKAKPKTIDPVQGPLVREAFDLYANGEFTLHELRQEMWRRGLRTKAGNPVAKSAFAKILRNPFYCGIIRVRRTGETFPGQHEPLIRKPAFDRVQAVLNGRLSPRFRKHSFLFRRIASCHDCKRAMTGELQKGHVYYRCHTPTCSKISIAEANLDAAIRAALGRLHFSDAEIGDFRELLRAQRVQRVEDEEERLQHLNRDIARLDERLGRLTDALIDGILDTSAHNERRQALLIEKQNLEAMRNDPAAPSFWVGVAEKFELGIVAQQSYILGNDDEKRQLVKAMVSNFSVRGKTPVIRLVFPLSEFQQPPNWGHGAPFHPSVRNEAPNCQAGNFLGAKLMRRLKRIEAPAKKTAASASKNSGQTARHAYKEKHDDEEAGRSHH